MSAPVPLPISTTRDAGPRPGTEVTISLRLCKHTFEFLHATPSPSYLQHLASSLRVQFAQAAECPCECWHAYTLEAVSLQPGPHLVYSSRLLLLESVNLSVKSVCLVLQLLGLFCCAAGHPPATRYLRFKVAKRTTSNKRCRRVHAQFLYSIP